MRALASVARRARKERRNDRDDSFEVGGSEIRTYAFCMDAARVQSASRTLDKNAQLLDQVARELGM